MHVLYPLNPLDGSRADDPYQAEFSAMVAAGHPCSLFDFDALAFGEFAPRPRLQSEAQVLYRGWMLNAKGYAQLVKQIEQKGGVPITSSADYLRCHHLPGWYSACSHLTAETHFFAADADLERNVAQLDWGAYFVKDYVKSNTGDLGAVATTAEEVSAIATQIATYRGEIEGGIAIRRVEKYKPNTERRYFVVRGTPYAQDGNIPDIVREIASLVDAPFYSVDVIENVEGKLRLVELGDGQVSDKKDWPMSKFVEVIGGLG